MKTSPFLVALISASACASPYRINHAGRILGPVPTVTAPTLFNTPQADAIVSAMQIYPITNAWNEDISQRPLVGNSAAMISTVNSQLSASRKKLRLFDEMNYVLVPDSQPNVSIAFMLYGDQSDPSPYPIPDNMPIESWPIGYGLNGQSLQQWQQDAFGLGGDRHGIIVAPGSGWEWETWQMLRHQDLSWEASNGARFNLNSNGLRPDGWTSGDAAGLAMFPSVVRYDECERGSVEHAMRLAVPKSRHDHIYPATHDAGSTNDPNTPAMGQRFRLRASFVIPSTWSKEERAVALALKKYGAIVADNSGGFLSISVSPDQRFPSGWYDNIQQGITINDFEVVQTTGATEGPRSPNPPQADAGSDFTVNVGTPAAITGKASGGSAPLSVRWSLYSGPAGITFGNAAAASTTVTISTAGSYVLMLKADDGIHTPAYSAVSVTAQVNTSPSLSSFLVKPISIVGGNDMLCSAALSLTAPTGGTNLTISSSNTYLAPMPRSVTVAAGTRYASWYCHTGGAMTSSVVNVACILGSMSKVASATILPGSLYSHVLYQTNLVGGTRGSARIGMNGKAWMGGVTVQIQSSNPVVASVPSSIVIPAGTFGGSYVVSTSTVSSTTAVTITASYGNVSKSVLLTVQPG